MSETNRREITLGQPIQRDATLDRASFDEEKRTVILSFASATDEVERFYRGEIVREVLDMDSFNLDRMNSGGALLLNHDPDQQVGGIVRAWIGEDENGRKVARAEVKFSRSERGEEIFQDVKDGIRGSTSVGYELDKEVSREERDEEVVVNFAANALEVSLVGVPADASVGVGRSNESAPEPETKPKERLNTMSDENNQAPAPAPAPAKVEITKEEREKIMNAALGGERKRIDGIRESAKRFNKHEGVEALAQKAEREGHSVAQFNQDLIEHASTAELRDFGMSPKEKRDYSVVRAINNLVEGRPVDGLEAEISRAVAEEMGGKEASGFYVPINAGLGTTKRSKRATDLDTVTSTTASEIVPDVHRGDLYVEFLRPELLLEDLGARIITGVGPGTLSIPRGTDGAQITWQTEATATTQDEVVVDDINLNPYEGSVYTQYTRRLLANSSPAIEGLVRSDLNDAIAVGLDTAWLTGNGTNKPEGVINATGIGTVSVTDANGPTYGEALSFESDVATANALRGSLAWVTTPAVAAVMKAANVDSGSGRFVWQDNQVVGYRAVSTTMMSANTTVFGNFSDYLGVIYAPGVDILVDPYSGSTARKVKILANIMADGEARHGASFSKSA